MSGQGRRRNPNPGSGDFQPLALDGSRDCRQYFSRIKVNEQSWGMPYIATRLQPSCTRDRCGKTVERMIHQRSPHWRPAGAWTWSWTRSGCPGMSFNDALCHFHDLIAEELDPFFVVVWRRVADFAAECPILPKRVFGTEGLSWTVRILPGVLSFTGSDALRDQNRHEVGNTKCCPTPNAGIPFSGGTASP
jgi:hypothetical protein